jgi:hypothetical protein
MISVGMLLEFVIVLQPFMIYVAETYSVTLDNCLYR